MRRLIHKRILNAYLVCVAASVACAADDPLVPLPQEVQPRKTAYELCTDTVVWLGANAPGDDEVAGQDLAEGLTDRRRDRAV